MSYIVVSKKLTYGWKINSWRQLSPAENQGKHNIYIDALINGNKQRGLTVIWGWKGQRKDELSPPVKMDKPLNEPGCNIPIEKGQEIWIEIQDAKYPSERIEGFDTISDISWGHVSYYVQFELVTNNEQPPTKPSTDELMKQIAALAKQILELSQEK